MESDEAMGAVSFNLEESSDTMKKEIFLRKKIMNQDEEETVHIPCVKQSTTEYGYIQDLTNDNKQD